MALISSTRQKSTPPASRYSASAAAQGASSCAPATGTSGLWQHWESPGFAGCKAAARMGQPALARVVPLGLSGTGAIPAGSHHSPWPQQQRHQQLMSPSLVGPRWCWGTSSRRKGGGKLGIAPGQQSRHRGADGLGSSLGVNAGRGRAGQARLCSCHYRRLSLSPCRRSSLVITTKIFWGGK